MENLKLTVEIAAAYWDAKLTTQHAAFIGGVKTFKYLELTDHMISDGTNWFPISDCQLLLSPLSSISDEDAIEVAKIVSGPWARHFKESDLSYSRVDKSKRIGVFSNGNLQHIVHVCSDGAVRYYNPAFSADSKQGDLSVESRGEYCITKYTAAIDYLRSKSYDCGYGSIPSLIAAGIAIEKEKS